MSENIRTTGSIEAALNNLDPSITESNDEPDCPNCAKPRSKRKVERRNVKSGTANGPTEAVKLVPTCSNCGEQYERIRSDHTQDTTPNSSAPTSGKYRKSNSGTYHLLDGTGDTHCGYDGGEIVEEQVQQHQICGECTI